jgi:hypothetical protein
MQAALLRFCATSLGIERVLSRPRVIEDGFAVVGGHRIAVLVD